MNSRAASRCSSASGGKNLTFESIPARRQGTSLDARLLIALATHSTTDASLMYKNIGRYVAVRCDALCHVAPDVIASAEKRASDSDGSLFFFLCLFLFSLPFSSLFLPCHPFFLTTWVICISDVAWRFAGESAASISPRPACFAPSFVRRTSRMRICANTCVHTLCVW